MSSTPHLPPREARMTWRERLLTPVSRAAGRLLNGRNDGPLVRPGD